MDEECWAVATVRLISERINTGVRRHRATSKNEVPVRIRKNPAEHWSIAERKNAQEVRLRSTGCIFAVWWTRFAKGDWSERKRIFRPSRKAHPRCTGSRSAQGVSEPQASEVSRPRYAHETPVSK